MAGRRSRSVLEVLAAKEQRAIDLFGWALSAAAQIPGTPLYSYTIGLTARGLPEVLLVGLPLNMAADVLTEAAMEVRDGTRWAHGQRVVGIMASRPVMVRHVTATPMISPIRAIDRYGADAVRLLQVVWPDHEDRFPGEPGYAMGEIQPLLPEREPDPR